MSLLGDLKAAREDVLHTCMVCAWLEDQEPEVSSEMENWLKEGLSMKALLRTCQPHGLKVGATTFRRHVHECVLKDGNPCR